MGIRELLPLMEVDRRRTELGSQILKWEWVGCRQMLLKSDMGWVALCGAIAIRSEEEDASYLVDRYCHCGRDAAIACSGEEDVTVAVDFGKDAEIVREDGGRRCRRWVTVEMDLGLARRH
ncbi:hypothetical protein ACLOJK_000587 [Asimina triloba]